MSALDFALELWGFKANLTYPPSCRTEAFWEICHSSTVAFSIPAGQGQDRPRGAQWGHPSCAVTAQRCTVGLGGEAAVRGLLGRDPGPAPAQLCSGRARGYPLG